MEELDWVSYLEGELDPETTEDMKMILKFSEPNRKIFESLFSLRRNLKEMGEVRLPESKGYYDGLQGNIMAAVKKQAKAMVNSQSTSVVTKVPDSFGLSRQRTRQVLMRLLMPSAKQKSNKLKNAQHFFSLGN